MSDHKVTFDIYKPSDISLSITMNEDILRYVGCVDMESNNVDHTLTESEDGKTLHITLNGQALAATSLGEQEIRFLQKFAQIPFLPVARKMGDLEPVYLEDREETKETYSLILQILEKKGLISLDYDKPLAGMDQGAYAAYPIRGSMALTQRGQEVLTLLEYQGVQL